MATLVIQLDSAVLINDQIVSGLRRAIATGELAPDDELPPVRQLAADLGVNLNTVARAYRVLEAAGLVSAVRGRGSRVVSATQKDTKAGKNQAQARLCEAIVDAKLAGMSSAALRKLFGKNLASIFNEREAS